MSKATATVGQESKLQSVSYQAKRHVPHILYTIFRYAFIIGMAYVLLYPILIMATRAIRPAEDMSNPSVVWISSSNT
jgi:ABC-type glycerol-3-phosphate transport system permease component